MGEPPLPTRTLAAPQIVLPPKDKYQREYEAFQHLLSGLLPTHRGQYVLIHDGQVQAAGAVALDLALAFHRQHGSIPVNVGLVTDEPVPPVRIPHYRIVPASGDLA